MDESRLPHQPVPNNQLTIGAAAEEAWALGQAERAVVNAERRRLHGYVAEREAKSRNTKAYNLGSFLQMMD